MVRWHEARGEAIPGPGLCLVSHRWLGWGRADALLVHPIGGRMWAQRGVLAATTPSRFGQRQTESGPNSNKSHLDDIRSKAPPSKLAPSARNRSTNDMSPFQLAFHAGHLPTHDTSINERNGEHATDGLSGEPPRVPANMV
jgi:hypothetical protein